MKSFFKKIVTFYLKILTKIVIFRHRPLIIGVVGSTKKTETKELIKNRFQNKISIRANPRSYNTEIGLPLAVLYLPSGNSSFWQWFKILTKGTFIAFLGIRFPKNIVLELGAIFPGEMDYLLTIVKPDYLVCTNVSLGIESSPDEIKIRFNEIKKAILSVSKKGTVILNILDPWLNQIQKEIHANIITYSAESDSIPQEAINTLEEVFFN